MPIASKKLQQSCSEGVLADPGQALNTAGQLPMKRVSSVVQVFVLLHSTPI